jgi:hypothetical protein
VNELRDEGYDAIVTTQICIAPSVIAANEEDIPSVIITTGPATVKYDPTDKGTDKTPRFTDFPISKKILYPFIWAVHRWNTTAFTTASEVIAINEFDATHGYEGNIRS